VFENPDRAARYRAEAAECARSAEKAFNPALKGCFRALEHRWLKMAEQVEALYRLTSGTSRPESGE
jgi:hypothetical protein